MAGLNVIPEALAAASAQVAALTGRLIGVNAAHTAAMGLVMPPGADLASVKTAAALQAKGVAHSAMAAMGSAELGASAAGVGEASASYAIGETEGAAVYTAAGGAL
ncbi:MAG: PE family protein [Actinomycetia bacterium]|nr:PE family protein [Actinomycetes bacterium]